MRLSICIPTFNRSAYIGQLLDSVLAQQPHDCELEVVVSDNASTDDTTAIIESYRSRFDSLIYHRMDENVGADRNYLHVVDIASGDFCWLMGSDDMIEADGVASVEQATRRDPAVAGLSARVRAYDHRLEALIPLVTSDRYPATDVVLEGAEHIFSELNEYFGFISSNIVDRRLWQQVVASQDLEPYMNAWVHVYVIGRMIQQRPRWAFVAQPCVGWRSGNDSFVLEGIYRRLEIDVAGYGEVTSGLFGADTAIYRETMGRRIEPAFFKLLGAKMNGAPLSYYRKAWSLLFRYMRGYPGFWLRIVPAFAMPGVAPRSARWLYRRTLKARRAARINAATARDKPGASR